MDLNTTAPHGGRGGGGQLLISSYLSFKEDDIYYTNTDSNQIKFIGNKKQQQQKQQTHTQKQNKSNKQQHHFMTISHFTYITNDIQHQCGAPQPSHSKQIKFKKERYPIRQDNTIHRTTETNKSITYLT